MLIVLGVAAWRRRHRQLFQSARALAVSRSGLTLAALLLGILVPRAASAVQSAELYRTQASFYGRFEARIRFAPGEGVVSSFFLWKDGSSSTTSWNELDFEKINSTCRLQTNIWTGKGTQSSQINTPTFDICADYHNYAFEWTPDYIAWYIDGAQIRKVTGASVTEYTQNASQGMAIHFNIWAGNSTFGGTLNASILPLYQYLSWVQYSSYANGAFQQQWREEFNASTMPSGWAAGNWSSVYNLSTHNPANVRYANGIAVLAMTADNATGYSGTPPVDTSSGTGGASGTGGSGTGGTAGGGGRGGTGGSSLPGTGGTSPPGAGGTGGMLAGGAGGTSAGTGGTGTVDPSGSGGKSGSGSGSGGVAATGGASGTGGMPSSGAAGASAGCGCRAAGGGTTGDGGGVALLLIATCMCLGRSRIVTRTAPHR
jgi:endo-1,3-1,4-beta-glycanase ExoK